jgi:hypothetical protein
MRIFMNSASDGIFAPFSALLLYRIYTYTIQGFIRWSAC